MSVCCPHFGSLRQEIRLKQTSLMWKAIHSVSDVRRHTLSTYLPSVYYRNSCPGRCFRAEFNVKRLSGFPRSLDILNFPFDERLLHLFQRCFDADKNRSENSSARDFSINDMRVQKTADILNLSKPGDNVFYFVFFAQWSKDSHAILDSYRGFEVALIDGDIGLLKNQLQVFRALQKLGSFQGNGYDFFH